MLSRRWLFGSRSLRSAFTLLEILLAVTIMSLVATVTCMTFAAATSAWQRGIRLADSMNHGDFIIDQLAMGLRSAFYPGDSGKSPDYGFVHEDNGDGEGARDKISWIKIGGSLVGSHCEFAATPHRVEFFLDNVDGGSAVGIRAWQLFGQLDDFDPEDIDPEYLSKRVVGFSCRAALEMEDDGGVEWEDEWEETNTIPPAVEITLYLEPPDEDEQAVELKRVVELPVARAFWRRK